MDIAQDHADNVCEAVGDRLYYTTGDGYAQGEPREVDTSANPPYMRTCDDVPEIAMAAYVPAWKELKMNLTELERYFNKEEMAIDKWKPGPKKQPTHVTLNGGSYFMTAEQEEQFIDYYARAVQRGRKYFFTEQATPVMRLFVDLDFLQIKKIRDRDIEAAAFVVHKSVCKFYDAELKVVVSVGGYKTEMMKDADKPPIMIKTGVHLHWNVFVDSERAFNIRETILVDLENTFGKRVHPNNDWRDVVDSTVYGGKGPNTGRLRMMYSRKTDACPKCKNSKSKKDCDKCCGTGRMDTGRPYFPMFVLGAGGKRDLEQEEVYRRNIKQVILDTNIRTTFDKVPDAPKFSMPEGAPVYIESTRKSGGHKKTDLGFTPPSDPKLNTSTKVRLNNAGPEWDTIQKLLHLQEKYANVILTEVTSNEKKNQYVVHVNGANCRYCANIQREHNSNRIYFVVSAEGIVQRCHDNSDVVTEDMKFGLCSKYSLMMGKIPSHMVPLLFPKSAASKLEDVHYEDDEEQEHVQRPDKKSRRLLEIGDMISMSLYKTRWSTTLQTTSGEHMVAQSQVARQSTKASIAFGDPKYLTDIHAIDPCALGSRHRKALKELGFDNEPEQNLVKNDIRVQSLNKLSKKLYMHLSNAVEMAAYLDPLIAMSALEQGFDGLVSLRLTKGAKRQKLDYLL